MTHTSVPSKRGDLIYDVGMHRGEDTDFYLKKGFRVVGFEADPDFASHCRARFAAALAAGQLVIVEGAIVEEATLAAGAKTVRFYKNLDSSVWGTGHKSWDERNKALGTRSVTLEVPVISFRECLLQHGVPHYMKVDIEGADLICIGALLHFTERPDYLSLESEKVSFDKLLEEFRLLEQLGYTEFQAVQQSTIASQTIPPSPAREGRYVTHSFPYGSSGLFGRELPDFWQSRDVILRRYRIIFLGYRLLGDRSLLLKYRLGRAILYILVRTLGRDIPGWYDTHARLGATAGNEPVAY